jgi:hypothetical protein
MPRRRLLLPLLLLLASVALAIPHRCLFDDEAVLSVSRHRVAVPRKPRSNQALGIKLEQRRA